MKTKLKWGRDDIFLSIPDKNVLAVLEPSGGEPVADLAAEVAGLVKRPTAGPSLEEIVSTHKPETAAIIVNDMTRSTPTAEMLLPAGGAGAAGRSLLGDRHSGGHGNPPSHERRRNEADRRDAVFSKYRVENHDCDSPISWTWEPSPPATG